MQKKSGAVFERGFTIVELAVTVAVIGILLTVSAYGYGEWRQRSATTNLKSDLKTVAAAMEQEKNFSNGYPMTLPPSVELGKRVTVTLKTATDQKSYCAEARTQDYEGLVYRYRRGTTTPDKDPVQGTC